MSYLLVLPYPPSTNRLTRVVRNTAVKSAVAREYEALVKLQWAIQRRTPGRLPPGPLQSHVAVKVNVYRPQRSGDLDNRLKAVLDGLTGLAWADDRQVREIGAERFEDAADPRVVVRFELSEERDAHPGDPPLQARNTEPKEAPRGKPNK